MWLINLTSPLSGLSGCEEARVHSASHARWAGRGHHHLRRAAFRAQLRRHSPQQQQGRTPLPQPEALHGHTQSSGGCGVVADLSGRGSDGRVSHCEGRSQISTCVFYWMGSYCVYTLISKVVLYWSCSKLFMLLFFLVRLQRWHYVLHL